MISIAVDIDCLNDSKLNNKSEYLRWGSIIIYIIDTWATVLIFVFINKTFRSLFALGSSSENFELNFYLISEDSPPLADHI